MPHFHIDYSANLETVVDFSELCQVIRRAALETGVFPMAGIRVRATPCPHYAIADGAPEHGFIDLSVRLREGRPLDTRKAATAAIFKAAQTYLAPLMARQPVALSMEMRNIDAELSPKAGSIRDFLQTESK